MSRQDSHSLDIRINCRSWDQFIDFLDERVTPDGVFVPTETPQPVESAVQFVVTTPDGDRVSLDARVTSSLPPPAQRHPDSARPGMHLSFQDSAFEESQRIKAALRGLPTRIKSAPPRVQSASPRSRRPAQSPAAVLKKLQHTLFEFQRLSDIELLGLTTRPTLQNVHEAALPLLAAHHPHRYARYKDEPLSAVATQIFVIIQSAQERLSNPDKAPADGPGPRRRQRATRATFNSGRTADQIVLSEAKSLLEFNQFDAAEEHLQTLLTLDPGHHQARVMQCIVRARRQLGEGNPKAAAQHYAALLEIDPTHEEAQQQIRTLGRPRTTRRTIKSLFTRDDD